MATKIIRTLQRYALVGPVPILYYFLRDRALLALSSRVQVTGRIRFGRGCVVKPYAVIRTTSGRITFGRNCAVSSFDLISTSRADVTIGHNVRIGPMVFMTGAARQFADRHTLIVDQDYDELGITVGDDVLIGANVSIMAGVTIGDGAVIGAGSVVVRDVPPYAVVAGVPARFIRDRN